MIPLASPGCASSRPAENYSCTSTSSSSSSRLNDDADETNINSRSIAHINKHGRVLSRSQQQMITSRHSSRPTFVARRVVDGLGGWLRVVTSSSTRCRMRGGVRPSVHVLGESVAMPLNRRRRAADPPPDRCRLCYHAARRSDAHGAYGVHT